MCLCFINFFLLFRSCVKLSALSLTRSPCRCLSPFCFIHSAVPGEMTHPSPPKTWIALCVHHTLPCFPRALSIFLLLEERHRCVAQPRHTQALTDGGNKRLWQRSTCYICRWDCLTVTSCHFTWAPQQSRGDEGPDSFSIQLLGFMVPVILLIANTLFWLN